MEEKKPINFPIMLTGILLVWSLFLQMKYGQFRDDTNPSGLFYPGRIPSVWIVGLAPRQNWLVAPSSVTQSCPTLCDPMDCSTPGLPAHHQLPELIQTRIQWVSGAIQPSHPHLSHSPPAFNLSWHQGLFKWISYLYQVAKVLEFQLQHQSFQWIFRTDFL